MYMYAKASMHDAVGEKNITRGPPRPGAPRAADPGTGAGASFPAAGDYR